MTVSWYLQPAPIVFKVSGKDARRYLNNRLSQDLRSVAAGASVVAGALTPQGRVEGLFTVYVEADDTFYLACDGGERQPLFAALGRYIVADRVSIVDCSSESLVGHIAGEVDLSDLSTVSLSSPRNRLGVNGEDFLIVSTEISSHQEALEKKLGPQLSQTAYDEARFKNRFVQYPTEVNDALILTEAGLHEAVSFQKGCYVGQEVIERSDAIGKLPRRVERITFEGVTALAPQASIFGNEEKHLGKVLSVIPGAHSKTTHVFALLKTGSYAVGDRVRCEGSVGTILSFEGE